MTSGGGQSGKQGGGEGGAGLPRSTLIEQLVHKMDDLPQGAIRPGSSWKREEGKGGVGKRKGVRERQDPTADKCQNKADKPGSRERDGVEGGGSQCLTFLTAGSLGGRGSRV